MRYYAPLETIFQRPALPRLRGPFCLAAVGVLSYLTPGSFFLRVGLQYAAQIHHATLTQRATMSLGKAIQHIGGSIAIMGSDLPILLRVGTDLIGSSLHAYGRGVQQRVLEQCQPRWWWVVKWAFGTAGFFARVWKPILGAAALWAGYVIARRALEPPPYEAPPGVYPSGGPLVEIAQEEAPDREGVFVCPAPLARAVQERVLLCERDPVMIQKVKTLASKWCEDRALPANLRYQYICGAVAAAMTVPINEQLVLQYQQSHGVKQQQKRVASWITGNPFMHDPWWSKWFSIRR